jgi:hypothetical protein
MKHGKRPLGPLCKKLAIKKYTRDAIPPGGGILEGLKAIQDMNTGMPAAFDWMFDSIDQVRASDSRFLNVSDETIAAIVLAKVAEKEGES